MDVDNDKIDDIQERKIVEKPTVAGVLKKKGNSGMKKKVVLQNSQFFLSKSRKEVKKCMDAPKKITANKKNSNTCMKLKTTVMTSLERVMLLRAVLKQNYSKTKKEGYPLCKYMWCIPNILDTRFILATTGEMKQKVGKVVGEQKNYSTSVETNIS
jgi:hypothetical protein